jgi:hypothetical protein
VADHIWAVILIMLLAGGVKFALALLYVDGRPSATPPFLSGNIAILRRDDQPIFHMEFSKPSLLGLLGQG